MKYPIEQVEQEIRAVIERVTALGWRVVKWCTIDVENKCCCPMSAADILAGVKLLITEIGITSGGHRLGLDHFESSAFAAGWDLSSDRHVIGRPEYVLYQLGEKLSLEYKARIYT